ncbi:hypothetical protein C8E87_0603 [Paractinoplanes brasiliensis]|uniref:Uncharacterized protein n=1 Tax=Paractinoplanes brasiliensis TaxID=52695 RepID=A0A4R6JL48_9ACTN|nr:hypothetical protein C8E87_0603 [Actinoplanes brasiliensis]GID30533.1 hypothetical protein Abr02nite_55160 [Actinoplanes brasiliensis]
MFPTIKLVTVPKPSVRDTGRWPAEIWIAAASTAAVFLLLLLPIRIHAPGDMESKKSCGNALSLNLRPWAGPSDGDYFTPAFQSCTSRRQDRFAATAVIISISVLVLSGMAARRWRPTAESDRSGPV